MKLKKIFQLSKSSLHLSLIYLVLFYFIADSRELTESRILYDDAMNTQINKSKFYFIY